jgi:hypothetical protein
MIIDPKKQMPYNYYKRSVLLIIDVFWDFVRTARYEVPEYIYNYNPEVPGSILGAIRFSEKQGVWN